MFVGLTTFDSLLAQQIQHLNFNLLLNRIAKKLSLHWHPFLSLSRLHVLIYDFEPMKLSDTLHASLVMSQPGHSYGCILLCRPFAFVCNVCIQNNPDHLTLGNLSLPVAHMLCRKRMSAPQGGVRRHAMIHSVGQS